MEWQLVTIIALVCLGGGFLVGVGITNKSDKFRKWLRENQGTTNDH